MSKRYSIRPYKVWQNSNGLEVSIFSANPGNQGNQTDWKLVTKGFTVYDQHTNTSGFGRKPFSRYEDAQEFVDSLTKSR